MTHLRCGGKYDKCLVANLLLSPTVKVFLKSANISQSYERISSGMFLWPTVYDTAMRCYEMRSSNPELGQSIRSASHLLQAESLYCIDFLGRKNQSFRNKSGKMQPIRTKFATRGQVKGWQRSGNFGGDRSIFGKMGAGTISVELEFFVR